MEKNNSIREFIIFIMFALAEALMLADKICFDRLLPYEWIQIAISVLFVVFHVLILINIRSMRLTVALFTYWLATLLYNTIKIYFLLSACYMPTLKKIVIPLGYIVPGFFTIHSVGSVRIGNLSITTGAITIFVLNIIFLISYLWKIKKSVILAADKT